MANEEFSEETEELYHDDMISESPVDTMDCDVVSLVEETEEIPEDVDEDYQEMDITDELPDEEETDCLTDIPEDVEQYEANGYSFIKNSNGQIISASGDLRLEEGERDPAGQREAGDEFRREYDDGGHLIGTRFNGPGGKEYLVPQDRHVNRANYKSLEDEWAYELKKGNDVHVDIEPVYYGTGKRPDLINGSYDVTENGKVYKEYFSMTNENLDSEEFALPEVDETDVYPNAMDTDHEKYAAELDENFKIKKDDIRRI